MTQLRTFPTRAALRRLPFGLADVALLFGVLALLYGVARVSAGAFVSFNPPEQLVTFEAILARRPSPRFQRFTEAHMTLREAVNRS